jgi:hypothetical protein
MWFVVVYCNITDEVVECIGEGVTLAQAMQNATSHIAANSELFKVTDMLQVTYRTLA